nr:hypothetical protein [Marinicella sp. W31]MDC2876395.1 hypothetical protein [Marinicella sp. W31]
MLRQTKRCLTVLLLAALASAEGCARIPAADVDFLEQRIPVGRQSSTARLDLEKRGFSQRELIGTTDYSYNAAKKRAEERTVGLQELARQNIGFVDLKGEPEGQLSCFSKEYSVFLGSGWRLICWTVNEDNLITWRQAGWVGVGL